MVRAAIFDVDGTLIDSVDLHALAWQEALARFGHAVTFEQARGQIGKGGDQLIPVFLTEAEQRDHGAALETWRGRRFKERYLPMVRPFAAVPELLARVRQDGLRIAAASSAKREELETYLDIAGIAALVDEAVSSEDAARSKPAPDIFQATLEKLGLPADDAMAIGDTPYDASAASQIGLRSIGMLSGCFPEADLRQSGCVAVYPGPAALLACYDSSPLHA
jgi:HAD superfamily hydrolase (TIGR01509 family)